MSWQRSNYLRLYSLGVERKLALELDQMELVRIRTYQMASQKLFLLSNLYPGLCDNNHFSSLWSRRTLLLSALRTSRQSLGVG